MPAALCSCTYSRSALPSARVSCASWPARLFFARLAQVPVGWDCALLSLRMIPTYVHLLFVQGLRVWSRFFSPRCGCPLAGMAVKKIYIYICTKSPIREDDRQISVHESQMKIPPLWLMKQQPWVEHTLDRESCLRGRGARIKRTHTKLELCSRNQDVGNKKPFITHLPEPAGQHQGF